MSTPYRQNKAPESEFVKKGEKGRNLSDKSKKEYKKSAFRRYKRVERQDVVLRDNDLAHTKPARSF